MPIVTLRVITAATLLVNLLLAGGLMATSGMTLSAAIFALAIQRIADATCHVLLAFGSARAAGAEREGHLDLVLPELRFWSLVTGLLVFSLASGVAISEGIARLGATPAAIARADLACWVLAALLAADIALLGAIRRSANRSKTSLRSDRAQRSEVDPVLRALKVIRVAGIVGSLFGVAGLALYGGLGWRQGDVTAAVAIALAMGMVAALFSLDVRATLAQASPSRMMEGGAPDIAASAPLGRTAVAPSISPSPTGSGHTSQPAEPVVPAGSQTSPEPLVARPANANANPRGNYPPNKPGKGKKKRR